MADNKNKDSKNMKNNSAFFKEVKAELKKVTWPTAKEVVNSTTGVIVIVLITALIVFILDISFKNINQLVMNKISDVSTSVQIDKDSSETSQELEKSEEDTGSEIELNVDENGNVEENTESENVDENIENSES